jgi:hypothetical protein
MLIFQFGMVALRASLMPRKARSNRKYSWNHRHLCAAIVCAVGLLATALVPLRSLAATYNEDVDGDLAWQNPISLITLDPGLNTVSGTFGNVGFPTDYDSFAFTIPAGLALAGGVVEVSDNVNNIVNVQWNLRTGAVAGAGALIDDVFSLSPGADEFGGLPAGTYHMGADFFNVFGQSTADYTFSLRVVAVPEPANLALLALAAPALIWARRTPKAN